MRIKRQSEAGFDNTGLGLLSNQKHNEMKQIIVRQMTLSDLILNFILRIRFWILRNFLPGLLSYSTPRDKEGWKLDFEDDFDEISWSRAGVNTPWKVGQGWGAFHPDHPRSYYGEPELEDGLSCAKFTARYNPHTFPDDYRTGKPITIPIENSLLSTTTDGYKKQYGRYECRMTLPAVRGSWPAFWIWGQMEDKLEIDDSGNPVKYYAEIDCGEWYGKEDGSTVGVQEINIHGNVNGRKLDSLGSWKVKIDKGSRAQNQFHEYAFEWSPNKIELFTDGVRVFRFSRIDYLDKYFNRPGQRLWIVINNGVSKSINKDDTDYYSEMYVDYIRVYQKEN